MSILNQPVNSDNRGFFRNIIDWFRGNSAEPIINDIPIINNPIIETEKPLEEEKVIPLLIEEEKEEKEMPLLIEEEKEEKEMPLLIEEEKEEKEMPLLIEEEKEEKEMPLLIEEEKEEIKSIPLEEQIVLQNNKKKNKNKFKGKK